MALDIVKNFSKVTVYQGYDAAETSIALTAGTITGTFILYQYV